MIVAFLWIFKNYYSIINAQFSIINAQFSIINTQCSIFNATTHTYPPNRSKQPYSPLPAPILFCSPFSKGWNPGNHWLRPMVVLNFSGEEVVPISGRWKVNLESHFVDSCPTHNAISIYIMPVQMCLNRWTKENWSWERWIWLLWSIWWISMGCSIENWALSIDYWIIVLKNSKECYNHFVSANRGTYDLFRFIVLHLSCYFSQIM